MFILKTFKKMVLCITSSLFPAGITFLKLANETLEQRVKYIQS